MAMLNNQMVHILSYIDLPLSQALQTLRRKLPGARPRFFPVTPTWHAASQRA